MTPLTVATHSAVDAFATGERSTDLDEPSISGADKLRMFNHQDGVGATRQHAAGRDGGRVPGVDGQGGHDAGRKHLVVQLQRARCFLHRAERVLRPHREAVDIGAIETRDIDACHDVLGEHTAEGIFKGH